MKKSVWILLMVAGVFLFSQVALADKITIDWWAEASAYEDYEGNYVRPFEVLHPEVRIMVNQVPSGNFDQLVPIAVASGEPPNVLFDYVGRLGIWHAYEALAMLQDMLTEEDLEDLMFMDLFTDPEGNIFGIPIKCWAIPYVVDFNILKEVGMDGEALGLQDDFTMDTWMTIAEKVRAAGYFATALFANNHMGDYWFLTNYLFFGAHLYEGGDYEKSALNSEAGVEALEWMGMLVEEKFVPPGVAGLTYRNYLNYLVSGEMAMGAATTAYSSTEKEQARLESGQAKQLQDYRIVPTPHKEGIPTPGLFIGPTGFVVFKNRDPEVERLSKEFVLFITNTENQQKLFDITPQFPARKSVKTPDWEGSEEEVALALLAKYGSADMGLASPMYNKCRIALPPTQQAYFAGMNTAKEVLDDYAEIVERIWVERYE